MILWSAVNGTNSSLVSGVWPCAQSCCWSQAGSSGWWHGRGGGPVGRFCPWCSPPDWPIVPLYHTQGTKLLAYGLMEAKRRDIDSSENVWRRLNSMVAVIKTLIKHKYTHSSIKSTWKWNCLDSWVHFTWPWGEIFQPIFCLHFCYSTLHLTKM